MRNLIQWINLSRPQCDVSAGRPLSDASLHRSAVAMQTFVLRGWACGTGTMLWGGPALMLHLTLGGLWGPPPGPAPPPAPSPTKPTCQHVTSPLPHCYHKRPQCKEVAVICTGLGRGEYLGKLKTGQLDPEGSGHQHLAGVTWKYLAKETLYPYFSVFQLFPYRCRYSVIPNWVIFPTIQWITLCGKINFKNTQF